MFTKGEIRIKYWGKKVFVGTLVEKAEKRKITDQGNILCIKFKNNFFIDVVNSEYYCYFENEAYYFLANGDKFVLGLNGNFQQESMNNIYRRKTLLKLAQHLNSMGYSISIPNEEMGKAKIKKTN